MPQNKSKLEEILDTYQPRVQDCDMGHESDLQRKVLKEMCIKYARSLTYRYPIVNFEYMKGYNDCDSQIAEKIREDEESTL